MQVRSSSGTGNASQRSSFFSSRLNGLSGRGAGCCDPGARFTQMNTLLFISIAGFGAGALIGLFLSLRSGKSGSTRLQVPGKNMGFGAAFVASVAAFLFALSALRSNHEIFFEIQTQLWGALSFHVDQLSAFFLLVISILGCAVSLYSIAYAREFVKRRNIGLFLF